MIHLRSLALKHDAPLPAEFPFNVPVVRTLDEMPFPTAVTFFVGENGSGKSTLLQAIACAADLPTIGSSSVRDDPTLAHSCRLSDQLKWAWRKRTRRGFFMRSEDFFGFARFISQQMAYLRDQLDNTAGHAGQSDFAQRLSKMPYAREYAALKQLYGDGLDVQSHGERYVALFQSRFRPDGLYLMDEPEAPLSPMRQLALIAMLHEMTQQAAQFIIATHSPIVLAYPGATLYNFDGGRITQVAYDDLEHVRVTRDFLNHPQAYLRHLLHDSERDGG